MKRIVSLGLSTTMIAGGCGGFLSFSQAPGRAESPVQQQDLLTAPDFDDVSKFGEEDTSRIDSWLKSQLVLADYPSLSVAIVRDDAIVYQRCLGYSDVENQREATSQTPYHLASVTKVFTALLTVILDQRGVVDLDASLAEYLPVDVQISTTPAVRERITLRHLASHTSGLPRSVPGPVQSVDDRYQLDPKRLYTQLSNVKLEFEPGTDELYSNLAMGLLGHILELATEKPLDLLMQEHVFGPLNLSRTAISGANSLPVATGYDSGTTRRPTNYSRRKRLASSGGLVASTDDLARFLIAHLEPEILSAEILASLHTPTKLSDGSVARTGLGWAVRSRKSIGRILKKNGGRNNCSAWIGLAPAQRVGVAVVTNCGSPDVDAIGYWLLERSVAGVAPSLLDRKPVTERVFAKVAPFTGVRWEGDKPIVRVQDQWTAISSIDGIPIERVIALAKKEFGEKSKKRFSEDLVEVLSAMGHDPQWHVKLELESSDGESQQLIVEMTEENRSRVRKQ